MSPADESCRRLFITSPVIANTLIVDHRGCRVSLRGTVAPSELVAPDEDGLRIAYDALTTALRERVGNLRIHPVKAVDGRREAEDPRAISNWETWAFNHIPLSEIPSVCLTEEELRLLRECFAQDYDAWLALKKN